MTDMNEQQAQASFNNALNHLHQAQPDQALAILEPLAQALPRNPNVIFLLGVTKSMCGNKSAAIKCYDRVLTLEPAFSDAYVNRSADLFALGQFKRSAADAQASLKINPNNPLAWLNLGNAQKALGQQTAALTSYQQAVAINPHYADAWFNLGDLYDSLGQYDAAIKAYSQTLAIDPHQKWLRGNLVRTRMTVCDWDDLDAQVSNIKAALQKDQRAAIPFSLLGLPFPLADQRRAATIYSRSEFTTGIAWSPQPQSQRTHGKIRIAYLSADYHNHATAYLIAELFELHDTSRFEVIGICYGRSPNDEMRQRISRSFDQFIVVADKTDAEIAGIIRELEIDIAIDLKGYTQDSRLGILASRPAPIQMHFLGYPGTLGAPFIDYLVADPVLIPPEHQPGYTEKIVYLPDTYQVNDRHRDIATTNQTRRDQGLPEDGFVFCCFNNNWKITPDLFDVWCRLLNHCAGSVLWLLKDNDLAASHLIQAARTRGIDADRLVFAERLPLDQHLSRHQHADLFLDTRFCNAHTTASDALWAGLPLLTLLGDTYASRVGASLLTAIDLPELITRSLEEYEALAVELVSNRDRLAAIRQKLADNRLSKPLFDTQRFTRHLENAYEQIFARHQQGLAPDHIHVPHA